MHQTIPFQLQGDPTAFGIFRSIYSFYLQTTFVQILFSSEAFLDDLDPGLIGFTNGVVLSTGPVQSIVSSDNPALKNPSYDFDPRGPEGCLDSSPSHCSIITVACFSGDAISLTMDFDADDTVEVLVFRFMFASSELPSYGGLVFNDRVRFPSFATLSNLP